MGFLFTLPSFAIFLFWLQLLDCPPSFNESFPSFSLIALLYALVEVGLSFLLFYSANSSLPKHLQFSSIFWFILYFYSAFRLESESVWVRAHDLIISVCLKNSVYWCGFHTEYSTIFTLNLKKKKDIFIINIFLFLSFVLSTFTVSL